MSANEEEEYGYEAIIMIINTEFITFEVRPVSGYFKIRWLVPAHTSSESFSQSLETVFSLTIREIILDRKSESVLFMQRNDNN